MLTQDLPAVLLDPSTVEAEYQLRIDNPVGFLQMVAIDQNDGNRIDAVRRLGKIASGDQLIGDILFAEVRFTTEDRAMALQALQELTTNSAWDVKDLATRQLTLAR